MNEQEGFSPEDIEGDKEHEPTSRELAEACKEVLSEEDCEELSSMEIDDAIGYAFTLLIEAGEDPEEFLKEKGILE